MHFTTDICYSKSLTQSLCTEHAQFYLLTLGKYSFCCLQRIQKRFSFCRLYRRNEDTISIHHCVVHRDSKSHSINYWHCAPEKYLLRRPYQKIRVILDLNSICIVSYDDSVSRAWIIEIRDILKDMLSSSWLEDIKHPTILIFCDSM